MKTNPRSKPKPILVPLHPVWPGIGSRGSGGRLEADRASIGLARLPSAGDENLGAVLDRPDIDMACNALR